MSKFSVKQPAADDGRAPKVMPYWNRGRIGVVSAGIGAMLLGYAAIPFTDSMAQNAASWLAPLLIIGGIVAVLRGFLMRG